MNPFPRVIIIGGRPADAAKLRRLDAYSVDLVAQADSPSTTAHHTLQVGTDSAHPIIDLLEGAQRDEWSRELDSRTGRLGKWLESDGDQRERLRVRGPVNFPSPADAPISPDPTTDAELHQRELFSLAQSICARRTLFCLGSGAAPPERVTTLFGLIARELSKFDMSLQNQRISFARVDDQEEEVRVRFVEFIGTLVTTITPAPVGKFNKTREGPTLLMGETGTGKTAMAKRMHSILGKERPFIHINIAAINPELLESRLRGYKKGAFTGASMDQRGWFEDANGGVLFLDEFQSAPEATQLQMLDLMSAVSDTVEVARVGEDGDRKKSCRVRLVLAINKSLDAMRNEGLLRPDLFHRIRNVIELEPLSRRIQKSPALLHALLAIYRWKSNLPLRLAESQEGTDEFPHLKSMFPILSDEILNELGSYSWPGNIREFEKVCYDLYEECDELCVASPSMDVFSDAIRFGNGARGGNARKDLGESLDEGTRFRLTYVQQTLKKHKFVVKPALKELGSQSLGSRPALKHFLREHRSQLADWFVTDSRIATLLGD